MNGAGSLSDHAYARPSRAHALCDAQRSDNAVKALGDHKAQSTPRHSSASCARISMNASSHDFGIAEARLLNLMNGGNRPALIIAYIWLRLRPVLSTTSLGRSIFPSALRSLQGWFLSSCYSATWSSCRGTYVCIHGSMLAASRVAIHRKKWPVLCNFFRSYRRAAGPA